MQKLRSEAAALVLALRSLHRGGWWILIGRRGVMSEKHRAARHISESDYHVFAEGAGEQFFRRHPSPTARRDASIGELGSVGCDDRRVVAAGSLDGSPLIRVVDVHEPESFGEAMRPLIVIEQRPGVVSAQIDALLHRIVCGA